MKENIDWDEVSYLVTRFDKGLLTKEALTRRVYICLKKRERSQYLTLKMVQAIMAFNSKGVSNEDNV